jgi:hypothetical protein
MSMLDELYTYIPATNSAFAGLLHLGHLPESPNRAIALYEYGSGPGIQIMETLGMAYEDVRLQVVCRGSPLDYVGPRTDCYNLMLLLMVVQNASLSGTWYLSIDALQSPFMIERDTQERVKIANNYRIVKRLS